MGQWASNEYPRSQRALAKAVNELLPGAKLITAPSTEVQLLACLRAGGPRAWKLGNVYDPLTNLIHSDFIDRVDAIRALKPRSNEFATSVLDLPMLAKVINASVVVHSTHTLRSQDISHTELMRILRNVEYFAGSSFPVGLKRHMAIVTCTYSCVAQTFELEDGWGETLSPTVAAAFETNGGITVDGTVVKRTGPNTLEMWLQDDAAAAAFAVGTLPIVVRRQDAEHPDRATVTFDLTQ